MNNNIEERLRKLELDNKYIIGNITEIIKPNINNLEKNKKIEEILYEDFYTNVFNDNKGEKNG